MNKNDPVYQKAYRAKHQPKLAAYNLEYKAKNRQKLKDDRRTYTEKNKEKIKRVVWANKLRNRYGLTPDEFFQMVQNQMDKCAICGTEAKLSVDHCHTTGKVRGLLCGNCNRGIGLFKENSETLQNAINYLSNYGKR